MAELLQPIGKIASKNQKVRMRSTILTIGMVTLPFFGTQSAYGGNLAEDIWTVTKRANKFCLVAKAPNPNFSGFFESVELEKAFSIFDCFPQGSPQQRAYLKLARIIFSKDYGDTISSLRSKNAGLIKYFAARLKNDDTLFSQAKAFYDEIQAGDLIRMTERMKAGSFQSRKTHALNEFAGAGRFADLKPGWLFDLAIKHSQGNPNRAIELIAICGHDNIQNSLELLNRTGDQFISCPIYGLSDFFVARSLGRDFDIPESFKNKIAAIQAPTKGISVIPSKTYHIYGSAFFSCILKSEGLSNEEINATNSLIARAYRVIDMRNRILINEGYSRTSPTIEKEFRDDCKKKVGICPDFYDGDTYNQDREDSFVSSKLVEYDSYFLINRWSLFQKIPILGIHIDANFNLNESQLQDIPDGWSKDRFEKAVHKIATYAVDIEWTDQQHLIGSSFGQRFCK